MGLNRLFNPLSGSAHVYKVQNFLVTFHLGVDTRLEWRMHKLRGHISYKYGEDKYSIDELRKEAQNMMSFEDRRLQDDFKIIKRAVDNDHHEFISVHCERLLRDLFCMKSGERLFISMETCLDLFLAGLW